ncbi:rRNA maturation RNase YbeY [Bacillaceae bacterium Marseille-Q3522]|nr:rRNA maturation RNase YbeY [Bacillaceae bacterium Marseille-Q3522]
MSLTIDFAKETALITDDEVSFIEKLLLFSAEQEGITGDCELSVTFVTNQQIREINKEYRGQDKATDVLSFALEELGEGEMALVAPDLPRVLGDIIISVEKAEEQAGEYGHSVARELGFLAVHGFLHLLGYDHMNEKDEKVMFKRQKEILDAFGLQR